MALLNPCQVVMSLSGAGGEDRQAERRELDVSLSTLKS